MRVIKINVLRGPNFWSVKKKKLIQVELDIDLYEKLPTNKIDGFAERLTKLIPSLYSHHCSIGTEGGFIERMKEGTWMGHVIEHIALELQSLAGMECGFGRTRSTGKTGIYYVVFAYVEEKAGLYAAEAAIRLAQAVAEGKYYDIETDIKALSEIYYKEKLGPSTASIVDEAIRRDIPYCRLDNNSLVMLGHGANQRTICATICDATSNIAVELVQNKQAAKQVLENAYLPVPQGTTIQNQFQLVKAIHELGFPLVIKPIDGNHGRGITTNINSKAEAIDGFILAKQISDELIVERFIKGNDFRLLVIDYKLVAVAKRTPAMVTGNGFSTIKELIDEENQNPDRGEDHEKSLTKIKIDDNTQSILLENGLTVDSVLAPGSILYLKDTANISSGGTAEDVTDQVHPDTVFLAERTARLMNLNICGIDLITDDISVPLTAKNGAILEVNAAPGFRMHQFPTEGKARNVAAPVLDMLYPENQPSRIPITAVTGTNGKTTTTRLIAHIAMVAGRSVGYTTTDGIYLNKNLIARGDCSGPSSAAVILRDPMVNHAVLECARGGILRSGLGFDKCDISVVTNVSEDHLGLNGVNDLETLARVKSVVPETTVENGYAILNAEDDLVFDMKNQLSCNIALFGLSIKNLRIAEHCSKGGIAACVEDGWLTLLEGNTSTRIINVKEIPITFDGKYDCMIQNVLAATLAARLSNFGMENIKQGLKSFLPSPELNPGRMNIFPFNHFTLIVDYAHNIAGYQELQKYLAKTTARVKIGIIAATGDRREADIINMADIAAEIFDELIIRHDKDGRGKTNEELSNLLIKGINKRHSTKKVHIISDEKEALHFAIEKAPQGALIFLTGDNIADTLKFVEEIKTSNNSRLLNYGT